MSIHTGLATTNSSSIRNFVGYRQTNRLAMIESVHLVYALCAASLAVVIVVANNGVALETGPLIEGVVEEEKRILGV